MEPLVIKLSSHYYESRVDRLIRQLTPIFELQERQTLHIDLKGLAGIGQPALALLIATLVQATDRGLVGEKSFVSLPDSPPVARYVERMNLVKIVSPTLEREEAFVRRDAEGFMPCRRFHDLAEGISVGRELAVHLQERCNVDDVGKASVQLALGEITDNVAYHADTAHGGFAVCQHYKNRQAFDIAIVDLGVGIMESLARNPMLPTPADDAAALKLALTPRITSTPTRNAGLGLFVTAMLLQGNGGRFTLRSGNAVAYRGSENETRLTTVALPGTLATMRVRSDRPLNIETVYSRFRKELGDGPDL